MFDIATRPETVATLAADIPMDWRLVRAATAESYPHTDYLTADRVPVTTAEVLATYVMELEDTLATAVTLSLFTDARAGRDDDVPPGADRGGWVGDEFVSERIDGKLDTWGSLLWLIRTSKSTDSVLARAQLYTQEALAWLVRDGIAERIVVSTEWAGAQQQRLALRPQIYKPRQSKPVYDVLWGTSILRWGTQ